MRVVKILKKGIVIYGEQELAIGTRYIMSDPVVDQINKISPRCARHVGEFEDFYKKLNVADLKKGDKVFLFRSGGIGDIMFMLPLIKYLVEKYEVEMTVATTLTYVSILQNNPFIKKIVIMPFLAEEMEKYDWHLMFEGIIEQNEKATKVHAVNLFLQEAGIDDTLILSGDKIPELFLLPDELRKVRVKFKRGDVPRDVKKIGIQIVASSPIRTFPIEKLVSIAEELVKQGYYIFLYGGQKQAVDADYMESIIEKNVCNLVRQKFSLRESIVAASFMDLMIASDSAFIHIAGALSIPMVGLYGCFPSPVRMLYYKNAIAIDASVACSPSFIHGHIPCKKGSPSPCFSVVDEKHVLDAAYHLLGVRDLTGEYPMYNEFRDGKPIQSILDHIG